MKRRGTWRAVLVTGATLAAGLTATAALTGSAAAAVVNQTMDCGSLAGAQTMKIDGTAPASVTAGGTFEVTLAPQAGTAAGSAVKNLVWHFQAPAGSTVVAGSATTVGTGSTTSGTLGAVTTEISGSVVRLKVPGTINNGATFTPPALRFRLQATGAAGTILAVKAQSNPAYTLVPTALNSTVTCKTTGAAASFTSTTIAAAPTTTVAPASSTTGTPGTTTSTTAAPTTTAPPIVTTQNWSPTGCGSVQTVTAPANTTSVTITAAGGRGGNGGGQGGGSGASGAAGGAATATFVASPGQVYSGIIGCDGVNGGNADNSNAPAGWSSGGGAGRGYVILFQSGASAGSGGASTGACLGPNCQTGAGTPLVVAGGGGGGGSANCAGTNAGGGGRGGGGTSSNAAAGAGPAGVTGTSANGAGGAGGSNNGNAGSGSANGGTSSSTGPTDGGGLSVIGGGGGGGYVGGNNGGNATTGCKGGGGGGGGSSFVATGGSGASFSQATSAGLTLTFVISTPAPTTTTTTTTAPTTTEPVCTPDVRPFATVDAFVRQQYLDFAGRTPTAGELSTARNLISTCVETAASFIMTRLPAEMTTTDAKLVRVYHAFFKRPPDASGFAYWVGELDGKGRSIVRVSLQFANTPEFQSKYGTLDNAAFIELVYNNVLDRPSEPGGKAYWLNRMAAGTADRGTVMANFAESPENQQDKRPHVHTFRAVRGMLQKFPSTSQFTALVTPQVAVPAGPLTAAIDTLRLSPEYAARF